MEISSENHTVSTEEQVDNTLQFCKLINGVSASICVPYIQLDSEVSKKLGDLKIMHLVAE